MSLEQTLVSCEWLADHIGDESVRVIEVTSSENDEAYLKGHIPGAAWWYWKGALWHDSDREFATPEEMATHLGRIGVSPNSTVVLYGIPVQYGTYAYWTLKMAGHKDVRLLDGGITRWKSEGRPLETDAPTLKAVDYSPQLADLSSRLGRDNILANLKNPDRLLLDVRSPEEYNGERVSPPPNFDHGAERKGRIPGAAHLYYRDFVNEDDTFKSQDEIRRRLEQVGVKPGDGREIVTYCRLSHRATLAWFALQNILEMNNVKIYDGSWTEWGSIVGFPVEKG